MDFVLFLFSFFLSYIYYVFYSLFIQKKNINRKEIEPNIAFHVTMIIYGKFKISVFSNMFHRLFALIFKTKTKTLWLYVIFMSWDKQSSSKINLYVTVMIEIPTKMMWIHQNICYDEYTTNSMFILSISHLKYHL